MDAEKERDGSRRGRKGRGGEPKELELVLSRRPGAPRGAPPPRRLAAASAQPRPEPPRAEAAPLPQPAAPARKSARIVATGGPSLDAARRERERLLARLLAADGRGAITRAAREYVAQVGALPEEQPIMLQLLEHTDEAVVRDAILALERLLGAEPPHKRPLLDQRLRRLEEYAEEAETRRAASALRRALRA